MASKAWRHGQNSEAAVKGTLMVPSENPCLSLVIKRPAPSDACWQRWQVITQSTGISSKETVVAVLLTPCKPAASYPERIAEQEKQGKAPFLLFTNEHQMDCDKYLIPFHSACASPFINYLLGLLFLIYYYLLLIYYLLLHYYSKSARSFSNAEKHTSLPWRKYNLRAWTHHMSINAIHIGFAHRTGSCLQQTIYITVLHH